MIESGNISWLDDTNGTFAFDSYKSVMPVDTIAGGFTRERGSLRVSEKARSFIEYHCVLTDLLD